MLYKEILCKAGTYISSRLGVSTFSVYERDARLGILATSYFHSFVDPSLPLLLPFPGSGLPLSYDGLGSLVLRTFPSLGCSLDPGPLRGILTIPSHC